MQKITATEEKRPNVTKLDSIVWGLLFSQCTSTRKKIFLITLTVFALIYGGWLARPVVHKATDSVEVTEADTFKNRIVK